MVEAGGIEKSSKALLLYVKSIRFRWCTQDSTQVVLVLGWLLFVAVVLLSHVVEVDFLKFGQLLR